MIYYTQQFITLFDILKGDSKAYKMVKDTKTSISLRKAISALIGEYEHWETTWDPMHNNIPAPFKEETHRALKKWLNQ